MKIFAFREAGEMPADLDAHMGVLVKAETVERAAEMIADPALVAMDSLSTESQAKLVFDMVLNYEQALLAVALDLPILTEHKLMVARTSVAAMKDDSLKLFKCGYDGRYLIAAKDRDDALKLITEMARGYKDETNLYEQLRTTLAEQETPKAEFDGKRVPKVVNWQAAEWEKQKAAEPPMMPMPSQVM